MVYDVVFMLHLDAFTSFNQYFTSLAPKMRTKLRGLERKARVQSFRALIWPYRDDPAGNHAACRLNQHVFRPFVRKRNLPGEPFILDETFLGFLRQQSVQFHLIEVRLNDRIAGAGIVNLQPLSLYCRSVKIMLDKQHDAQSKLIDVFLICPEPSSPINTTRLAYLELIRWAFAKKIGHVSLGKEKWYNFSGHYLNVLYSKLDWCPICHYCVESSNRIQAIRSTMLAGEDILLFTKEGSVETCCLLFNNPESGERIERAISSKLSLPIRALRISTS